MKKWLAGLTIGAVLAAAGVAWAQPGPGGPGGPGKKPRGGQDVGKLIKMLMQDEALTAELGITEEQVAELEQMAREQRKETAQLRADVESAQVDLETLFAAEPVDEAAVMLAVEKVGRSRTEIQKARVRMRLGAQQVLGPEKTAALKKAVRKRMRERMQERREKRGSGGKGDGKPNRGDGPPWMDEQMLPPETNM